jgi:uncharacterized protein (TIGR02266 family)
MPSFSVVMTWRAGSADAPAEEWMRGLAGFFPRGRLMDIRVATSPAEALLLLRLQFDEYPQEFLRDVRTELRRCSGELHELLKMSDDARDAFWSDRLHSPRPMKDFTAAATVLGAHLRLLFKATSPIPESTVEEDEAPPGTRRAVRYPVKLEVEFRNEREFVHEHSINLSHGGVFVRSAEKPPLGAVVEVRIKLPDGRWLETHARVAHHRDGEGRGIGLEFQGDDPAFQRALDEYVVSLAAQM